MHYPSEFLIALLSDTVYLSQSEKHKRSIFLIVLCSDL